MDSWVWSPGLGFQGLDSWVWIPGLGVLGLDSWIWTPGLNLRLEVMKPIIWSPPWFGFLVLDSCCFIPSLDSWIWTPGLNLLPEVIKPMIWSPELQIMTRYSRSAVHPPGEGGPETRFFLQALHKLARALQVTLTWWDGLGEIVRHSFNITYATS